MNKKLVIVGCIGIVVAFFASTLIFAQEEDPDLAPFNASVTIQASPAFIPRIITVNDTYPSSITTDFNIFPTEGTTSSVTVIFVADDANTDLPTGSIDAVGTGAPGTVSINITTTSGVFGVVNIIGTSANTACNELPGYPGLAPSERAYNCTMSGTGGIPFYYEPNPLTGAQPNLYRVGVVMYDLAGTIPGPNSHNTTRAFNYSRYAVGKPIANLTWTNLATSLPDQRANNNLTIRNFGNVLLENMTIAAYNMTGQGYTIGSNRYIPANSIRADGLLGNECLAPPISTLLQENLDVVVNGSSINYGLSVSGQIYFCIFSPLTSYNTPTLDLAVSPYVASGPQGTYSTTGTRNWEVVVPPL